MAIDHRLGGLLGAKIDLDCHAGSRFPHYNAIESNRGVCPSNATHVTSEKFFHMQF